MQKSNWLFLSILFSIGIIITFYSCQEENPYKQGEILYAKYCSNCHMDDGTGLRGNIPPLANTDYVRNAGPQIACIINNGMEGEILVNGRTYNQPMAAVKRPTGDPLTEFEITNIINYINHAWGNDYGIVKLEDVRKMIESCKKD
ncbi:MAG: cytochrome c [Saprospiraceae bacterium]|nr:cytochrome c [Saprospiraceae bacterium]